MTWRSEVEQIQARAASAARMGGAEAVRRQHDNGKLTARERISRLLDDATFREIGILTGQVNYAPDGHSILDSTPSNVVIGKGRVLGRSIVVAADDYTIRGGSSEATSPEKWQYAEQIAVRDRLPLVRCVDMAGGSVKLLEQAQSTKLPGYPQWPWVSMLSQIPVAAIACGPCAGLGAQKVAATHFSVQVNEIGQVFAAGPRVVAPGVGEQVDKNSLGGAQVHAKGSGVVDNYAETEDDAIEQIRTWLSYFPRNVHEQPPRGPVHHDDSPNRVEEELLSIIPRNTRQVYDSRRLIDLIIDRASFFEIGRYWGKGAITGLARLNGYTVGILASDPLHYGGAQGEREAEKFTRFIDVCDTFHIPIVNLHDQPGTMVGSAAESRGTVRKTLRTLVSINQSTVPWFAVVVRRAYGVAGAGWGPWNGCSRVAWPSGRWGSIPIEGGVSAAHRAEIETSQIPDQKRQELEDHYQHFASPFRTAERFGIDDIIDPRHTRGILCA